LLPARLRASLPGWHGSRTVVLSNKYNTSLESNPGVQKLYLAFPNNASFAAEVDYVGMWITDGF